MENHQIKKFFEILSEKNPAPQTELYFTNDYTLLVAVILSARMTDRGVNKVTKSLFQEVSTPQDLLKLTLGQLEERLKTIGLYKTKAKNLMAMSQILISTYGGCPPGTFEDLIKLPGVGPKTARVVLNAIHKLPTIAVDTHVFRVSNRTGLAPEKTPERVSLKLAQVIPPEFQLNAHHWLLLHGRYICTARVPLCPACPVASLCAFKQKTGAS